MKHLTWILVLTAGLMAPATGTADSAEDEQLNELREELRKTQAHLRELTRKIQRLSRTESLPIREPRDFALIDRERPMVGIVMGASENRRGVRLAGVTPDGPAEKAGLRSGDLILEINGRSLEGRDAVGRAYALLDGLQAGDTFEFVYQRDGERATAKVTAELLQPSWSHAYRFELPDFQVGEDFRFGLERGLDLDLEQFKEYADRYRDWQWDFRGIPGEAYLWRFGFAWSGLELARLNPDLARYFGTSDGVLVIESDLADGSLAGGDVIVAIGGEPVNDPRQAMRQLARFEPGESIPLRIIRDRAELDLTLVAPSLRGPSVDLYFDDRDENGKRPSQ